MGGGQEQTVVGVTKEKKKLAILKIVQNNAAYVMVGKTLRTHIDTVSYRSSIRHDPHNAAYTRDFGQLRNLKSISKSKIISIEWM